MSQHRIGVGVTELMPANESLSARSTRKYIPDMFARTRRRGNFRDLPASRPDVAAPFLTFAKRMGKIAPRTRANDREKQYAPYPDGCSDYNNCMAPNGRKGDSINIQDGDNRYRRLGFLIAEGSESYIEDYRLRYVAEQDYGDGGSVERGSGVSRVTAGDVQVVAFPQTLPKPESRRRVGINCINPAIEAGCAGGRIRIFAPCTDSVR